MPSAILRADSAHQCFLLGASAAIATAANIPPEVFLAGWAGGRSLREVVVVAERLQAALGGPGELEAAARKLVGWGPWQDLASQTRDPLEVARRVLLTLLSNDHGELVGVCEPASSGRLAATFGHTSQGDLPGAVVRLVAGLCIASTSGLSGGEPHVAVSTRPGETRFVFSASPRQGTSPRTTANGAARDRLVAAAHDAMRASSRLAALERELARAPLDRAKPAVLAQRTARLARASFSRLRAHPSESARPPLPTIGARPADTRTFVLRANHRVVGTWEVRAEAEPAVLAAIAAWVAHALRPPRELLAGTATPRRVPAAWALTRAQTRVAERWLAGRTAKEIALELGIALTTVQTHIAGVHRRLGVRSRAALLARWVAPPAAETATDASVEGPGDGGWHSLPADIVEAIAAIAALRGTTAKAIEALRRRGQRAADGLRDETSSTPAVLTTSGTSAVPPVWALTARQREIVDQLVAGATRRQIASTLGLRPHTVDAHLHGIYERTGLRSRHLVATAVDAFRRSQERPR